MLFSRIRQNRRHLEQQRAMCARYIHLVRWFDNIRSELVINRQDISQYQLNHISRLFRQYENEQTVETLDQIEDTLSQLTH